MTALVLISAMAIIMISIVAVVAICAMSLVTHRLLDKGKPTPLEPFPCHEIDFSSVRYPELNR